MRVGRRSLLEPRGPATKLDPRPSLRLVANPVARARRRQVGADLEPREAANDDVLANLGDAIADQVANALTSVLDERLVEQGNRFPGTLAGAELALQLRPGL